MKKYHAPAFIGVAACMAVAVSANASGVHGEGHDHQVGTDHAMHMEMLTSAEQYRRTQHEYSLPQVELVDEANRKVELADWLHTEQPVILNFIYTSCSTICPVLSATLAEAQLPLNSSPAIPRIISISIDPNHDTPARLHDYAGRYRDGSDWHFLTGDSSAIVDVQRAFDVYRGDKSNHIPVTFMRASAGAPWVRLEGFTSAEELVREFERVATR